MAFDNNEAAAITPAYQPGVQPYDSMLMQGAQKPMSDAFVRLGEMRAMQMTSMLAMRAADEMRLRGNNQDAQTLLTALRGTPGAMLNNAMLSMPVVQNMMGDVPAALRNMSAGIGAFAPQGMLAPNAAMWAGRQNVAFQHAAMVTGLVQARSFNGRTMMPDYSFTGGASQADMINWARRLQETSGGMRADRPFETGAVNPMNGQPILGQVNMRSTNPNAAPAQASAVSYTAKVLKMVQNLGVGRPGDSLNEIADSLAALERKPVRDINFAEVQRKFTKITSMAKAVGATTDTAMEVYGNMNALSAQRRAPSALGGFTLDQNGNPAPIYRGNDPGIGNAMRDTNKVLAIGGMRGIAQDPQAMGMLTNDINNHMTRMRDSDAYRTLQSLRPLMTERDANGNQMTDTKTGQFVMNAEFNRIKERFAQGRMGSSDVSQLQRQYGIIDWRADPNGWKEQRQIRAGMDGADATHRFNQATDADTESIRTRDTQRSRLATSIRDQAYRNRGLAQEFGINTADPAVRAEMTKSRAESIRVAMTDPNLGLSETQQGAVNKLLASGDVEGARQLASGFNRTQSRAIENAGLKGERDALLKRGDAMGTGAARYGGGGGSWIYNLLNGPAANQIFGKDKSTRDQILKLATKDKEGAARMLENSIFGNTRDADDFRGAMAKIINEKDPAKRAEQVAALEKSTAGKVGDVKATYLMRQADAAADSRQRASGYKHALAKADIDMIGQAFGDVGKTAGGYDAERLIEVMKSKKGRASSVYEALSPAQRARVSGAGWNGIAKDAKDADEQARVKEEKMFSATDVNTYRAKLDAAMTGKTKDSDLTDWLKSKGVDSAVWGDARLKNARENIKAKLPTRGQQVEAAAKTQERGTAGLQLAAETQARMAAQQPGFLGKAWEFVSGQRSSQPVLDVGGGAMGAGAGGAVQDLSKQILKVHVVGGDLHFDGGIGNARFGGRGQ